MKGINQTHHVGSVIKPSLTYTPASLAVLEFTLGIREIDQRIHTAYVTAKVFGSYAETLEPHLKEGCVAEVFGELHQVSYEGKSGKRTDTTVTVKNLLLLGGTFQYWEDRKGQSLLLNGINEVWVSGNLTKDTTLVTTATGHVTKARVAVKDHEATLYLDVTCWDKLELKKGQGGSVTGRLLSDSYKPKGKPRIYTTYLEATRLTPLAKLT